MYVVHQSCLHCVCTGSVLVLCRKLYFLINSGIRCGMLLCLAQNSMCACDVDRGLLHTCASKLPRGDREIICRKSVHSRFRDQKAHKIWKRALPVEVACCRGPGFKILNCCASWREINQITCSTESTAKSHATPIIVLIAKMLIFKLQCTYSYWKSYNVSASLDFIEKLTFKIVISQQISNGYSIATQVCDFQHFLFYH